MASVAVRNVSRDRLVELPEGVLTRDAHAVVAVPDSKKGEQLMLITTHAKLDRKHLQEALRGKVNELMVPRHVMHVEELPLLGTGKTDYVTLGRMAREAVAK